MNISRECGMGQECKPAQRKYFCQADPRICWVPTRSRVFAIHSTVEKWGLFSTQHPIFPLNHAYTLYAMKLRMLISLALLLVFPVNAISQSSPHSSDLNIALARFVTAFDNLDWDAFRLSFEDDATVFYPRAIPARAHGRPEFEHSFKTVFEQIRGGRTSPPYMDIQPKDLLVQDVGDSIAIVTFHLTDRPGFLNRRTMVWHRTHGVWRIAHLHASEVAIASESH